MTYRDIIPYVAIVVIFLAIVTYVSFFTSFVPYQQVEIIMISFVISYISLEVALNLNDIDGDTSNVILLEWSQDKIFFIPFALGAIGGHLFLGTKSLFFAFTDTMPMLPVTILVILLIIMGVIGYKVEFKKTKGLMFSLFIAGLAYGHLMWSMNIPSS